MKGSLVAYDSRELHKNIELKITLKLVCKGLLKMADNPNMIL
jgi:hypothetical protein